MSLFTFQLLSAVFLLGLALWLFARTLPTRDDLAVRLYAVTALVGTAIAFMFLTGFSLFPTLTDDLSFMQAILSFLALLGLMVVIQLTIWDCSLLTALYCCSSAYLLYDLSDGLNRVLHLMNVIPVPITGLSGSMTIPAADVLSTFGTAAVTYLLAYRLIACRIERSALLNVRGNGTLFAVVLAISVSTVFDLSIKDLVSYAVPLRSHILFSLVHLATCIFILFAEFQITYNRVLQGNLATIERAMAEQKRQFELSRDTIDAINRRCHDIRHQVANTLADASADGTITRDELAQVVRDIDVYELNLRTGNAALDVALAEKGLLARKEGITLSVVADGHALDFMPSTDVYALFSAALDGSINALRNVPDPELHSISLTVRERMGMTAISLEHYLPSPDARNDEAKRSGELVLQTLREVVERHDGTISFVNESSPVMQLVLLIPQA